MNFPPFIIIKKKMTFGMLAVTVFWGTLFYKMKTTEVRRNVSMFEHTKQEITSTIKHGLRYLRNRYLNKKQREKQRKIIQFKIEDTSENIINKFLDSEESRQIAVKNRVDRVQRIRKLKEKKKRMCEKNKKKLLNQCSLKFQQKQRNQFLDAQFLSLTQSQPLKQCESLIENSSQQDNSNSSLSSWMDSNVAEQLQIEIQFEKNDGMILPALSKLESKEIIQKYNPFYK